jgi:hypothetical protein
MPLPQPLIVVVGLPRTGTTLLHTLLGCDQEALVLPFWQLRRPYPVPRRRLDRAARIMRAAAMARLARSMAHFAGRRSASPWCSWSPGSGRRRVAAAGVVSAAGSRAGFVTLPRRRSATLA